MHKIRNDRILIFLTFNGKYHLVTCSLAFPEYSVGYDIYKHALTINSRVGKLKRSAPH